MAELSPPPSAAAASSSMRGDSTSHRPAMSPFFPPPKNKRVGYTRREILLLSVNHGKSKVTKAILNSEYGPSRAVNFKMFPKRGEVFDEATIKDLLRDDEKGSKSWHDKIDVISNSQFGPQSSTIYAMFGKRRKNLQ